MLIRGVLLATVALVAAPAWVEAEDESCVGCHIDEDMEERLRLPAADFRQDVHSWSGIGCADCHGGRGDSDSFLLAHSKKAGFRAKPPGADIAGLCGECHDDEKRMEDLVPGVRVVGQGRRFRESVHGQVRPIEGHELPTCISCHGVHGIRSIDDMASAVHPTRVSETCARCHADFGYMRAFTSARVHVDQLIEYRTSVHGQLLAEGDTKVAVCSSCHGSHDIRRAADPNSSIHPLNVSETCGRCHADPEYMAGRKIPAPGGGTRDIPTDQLERYRESVHRRALSERGDLSAPTCNDCHGNHGATPPDIRTVATVCAQCHSRPAELFGPSQLKRDLDELQLPGCATCHGNHRILAPGDDLLDRIAGARTLSGWVPTPDQVATAAGFLGDIRKLEGEIARVEERVVGTEALGMDLTRARLRLNQARDHLIQARVTVHAFDRTLLDEVVHGAEGEPGGFQLVADAETLVEEALEERAFRRIGLVVALGIIALLIVVLVLKIRRMERDVSELPEAS